MIHVPPKLAALPALTATAANTNAVVKPAIKNSLFIRNPPLFE
jgi:hypothetical protein